MDRLRDPSNGNDLNAYALVVGESHSDVIIRLAEGDGGEE
jgi:hypothetical protein